MCFDSVAQSGGDEDEGCVEAQHVQQAAECLTYSVR